MRDWKDSSIVCAFLLMLVAALCSSGFAAGVDWVVKSSAGGDMQAPNDGLEQTCCIVLDIDKDGVDDFVVGERTKAPSVVWYKYNGKGWDRFVIDNEHLNPEAGGDYCDIDGDGDQDIILGQDYSGNAIWWWENPYPDFSKPWTRRYIKNSGPKKHHDQTVGDFDNDGRPELLSWNQGGKQLLWFEIPGDPKGTQPWPSTAIFSWSSGAELEGFPSVPVDVDLDGKLDLIGGGRWFKHKDGTNFEVHVIDDSKRFTQCAAGQLVRGGRPEIVFSPGDMDGDAMWYQWEGGKWVANKLRHVVHGHTCEIRDIDFDGNLDIMIGEMGDPGAGDNAKVYVWYGDGVGGFTETVASQGQGIHEGKLGDLDGDGDLDILLKPYHHKTPRLDVLVNGRKTGAALGAGGWKVLFDGKGLGNWMNDGGAAPNAKWTVEDGVLGCSEGAGMIWSKERFGDFVLDLEFKTEGNSGVFIRTDEPKDCVQTGLEMQVYKPVNWPGKHSSGALYDALAPARELTREGQWNHVTITAVDSRVTMLLNGAQIVDVDLNKWTTARKNPDGSDNKFRTALKDFKREGHIGFQDHGSNVWYRNVRVKQL